MISKKGLFVLGLVLIVFGFCGAVSYIFYWGYPTNWVEIRKVEWSKDEEKLVLTVIHSQSLDYTIYPFTVNADGTELTYIKGEYKVVSAPNRYPPSITDIPNSDYRFRRDCGNACIRVFRKSDDKLLFVINRDDLDIAARGGGVGSIPTRKIIYVLIILGMVGGGLMSFPYAYANRLLWLVLIIYVFYLFLVYKFLGTTIGRL